MMINKTDLRIGNSVMYKGEVYQVEELQEDDVTLFNSAFGWEKLDYSDVHPIPITEEALVKMGFVKLTDKKDGFKATSYSYSKFPFIVYFDGERLSVNFWQGNEKRYIHQLCNLFYSLTQTELTYEP